MPYPKSLEQEFKFLKNIQKGKRYLSENDSSEDEQINEFLKSLKEWGETITTLGDNSKRTALINSLELFTKFSDDSTHKFPQMIVELKKVFNDFDTLKDIDVQIEFLTKALQVLKGYCIKKINKNEKISVKRKKLVCRLMAATVYKHLKERRNFKIKLREEIRIQQKMSGASLDEIHGNLSIVEPSITSDIKSVYGSYISEEGLKFKLKGMDSLRRKIAADARDIYNHRVGYLFIAKNDMHDCIRYTILVENDELVDKFNQWDQRMEKMGYLKLRVKNFWIKQGAYKGINSIYATPYGYYVEIQFHSKQSFDLKENILHKLYEQQRVLDKTDPKREELQAEMEKESKKLGMPQNIETIKDYVCSGRFKIKIQ